MTDWLAFAGFTSVLVFLMLLLAQATQSMLDDLTIVERGTDGSTIAERGTDDPSSPFSKPDTASGDASRDASNGDARPSGFDVEAVSRSEAEAVSRSDAEAVSRSDAEAVSRSDAEEPASELTLTTTGLFANVVVTHGLFAGLVVAAALYWAVPAEALGAVVQPLGVLGGVPPAAEAVVLGVAFGLALALANEVGTFALDWWGVGYEDALREVLAPASTGGWAALLGGVLPLVAIAEELLFRAALIGAFAEGFGISAWLLAAVSSVLFAIGHGAQGRGGIVVTGLLGFALAAGFVLTGSLLLVIVAHYVVNAVELLVHEGLGIESLG